MKQKRQLEEARTQAYEMEDLAVGMKSNLKGQGQQIDKTRKDLRGIKSDAGLSKRFLKGIEERRKKNKYIVYSIFALLILLGIFLFWWRFGHYFSSEKDGPEVKQEY